ncbi:flagellar motor protein [Crocosphaera sp. Alani8]|uniref:flagellar motor protein n=1 Tax=Crocosphaera sp. Alani8 TaxID=3038952 RepID=UPI00313ADF75
MKISQLQHAELFTLLAFIFLLIIFSVQGSLTEENPEPNENPRELKAKIDKLTEENDKLKAKLKEREKEFPPNIIIEGAGKYAFPSGSGGLTRNLKNFIATDLVKIIEDNFNQYDIDTVVVIGHTDGQSVGNPVSNLDETLEKSATGDLAISNINPGSNADLGLIRALAVVKELQRIKSDDNRLQKLSGQTSFRAYSAGQLTLPNGEFAQPDPNPNAERRRIEIRFTKTRETTTAQ